MGELFEHVVDYSEIIAAANLFLLMAVAYGYVQLIPYLKSCGASFSVLRADKKLYYI